MRIRNCLLLMVFAGGCLGSCTKADEEPVVFSPLEQRLVKLHYESSSGELAATHFFYNRRGQNYQAVWHLADSSRSSVNHYSFDSLGRMRVKFREYSDSITSVQNYEYDSEGNLMAEDFSRSDGVKGSVRYIYGEDGRVSYADCEGLNGWFYGKIVYLWEGDRKTGADIIKDSVAIGSIVYDYNHDLLVFERWDFKGEWNQVFRYEYQRPMPRTYTSSNALIPESQWFRIASESYDFSGQSGGPSYYVYDNTGKLVQKEFIRSDGVRTLTTYDYDTTGLLDHSLREYGDGRTTDFLYWYSIKRELLVKTFTWSDGSTGSEAYRYKNDRMVRGEFVNVDGWLTGIMEFNYNDDGLLIGADYSADDGNHAKLDFNYDRNFNLLRIHWTFKSGHTQTYNFKYEPS